VGVLHVFDMDGTLLVGTTASIEIARAFGRLPELVELETAFAAGGLTTYAFAVATADLYRGLTAGAVAEIFAGCAWLPGIAEVAADIRRRGERSLVVTLSPDFFAGLLTGLGLDEVRASTFPPLPLRRLPEPSHILTPADKVTVVEQVLAREGLARDRCVAYGDSLSDLPLFAHLEHTVAVNATPELRRVASVGVDCDDLWPAYRAGRELVDRCH
jgi:phosphoserine phosphatase